MSDDFDLRPFSLPGYTTVTSRMMADSDNDCLRIDGIMTTVGDFQKIAEEWTGSAVRFIEMELRPDEVKWLAKWKGKRVELHLLQHEDYDLAQFVRNMRDWTGDVLQIGYSGPRIFNTDVAEAFRDAQYQRIIFYECTLPTEFRNKLEEMGDSKPMYEIIKSLIE